MRPTKVAKGKVILNFADFATKRNWLHWDLSPFHGGTSAAGFAPNDAVRHAQLQDSYGSLRVQGLITLTDCPVERGGFHCIKYWCTFGVFGVLTIY